MSALTVDANVWVAAFEPRDSHHFISVAFLTSVSRRGVVLRAPELLLVEVASALARRLGDTEAGRRGLWSVNSHPALRLDPLTGPRVLRAAALSAHLRIRGADAIYAATADAFKAPLISWDEELVARAGAMTPAQFLDRRVAAGA